MYIDLSMHNRTTLPSAAKNVIISFAKQATADFS